MGVPRRHESQWRQSPFGIREGTHRRRRTGGALNAANISGVSSLKLVAGTDSSATIVNLATGLTVVNTATESDTVGTLQQAGFQQVASKRRPYPFYDLWAVATVGVMEETPLRALAAEHIPA